jgi:hypothetical protein
VIRNSKDIIFPAGANNKVKCHTSIRNKKCHEVTFEIKYAVIKKETIVIGCSDTKTKKRTRAYNPVARKMVLSCGSGFVAETIERPSLVENGNQWKVERDFVYCAEV